MIYEVGTRRFKNLKALTSCLRTYKKKVPVDEYLNEEDTDFVAEAFKKYGGLTKVIKRIRVERWGHLYLRALCEDNTLEFLSVTNDIRKPT